MLVEFLTAARLAELIDSQGNRPCAEHRSKKRKRMGMAIDDGYNRAGALSLRNQVFEQRGATNPRVLCPQMSGVSPTTIKKTRACHVYHIGQNAPLSQLTTRF